MPRLAPAVLLGLCASVVSALRHHASQTNQTAMKTVMKNVGNAPQSFPVWYNSHAEGRGIWKWANAIDAYERHFKPMVGLPINLAEVGVQSGGSMLMWHACLGSKVNAYGMDINPKCTQFKDAKTTIVLGDQGDTAMWKHFYTKIQPNLDILVDDGSHEPPHMLTTLDATLPHVRPGGFVVIEDIHGISYLETFFLPAADVLAPHAAGGKLASVHVYPYLLITQEVGGKPEKQFSLDAAKKIEVSDLSQFKNTASFKPGDVIEMKAKAGDSLLTAANMKLIFQEFVQLHGGSWTDTPTGCSQTSASECEVLVTNSAMQDLFLGYHIYPAHLIVEVAKATPRIYAQRRGTEWINYR